MKNEYLSGYLIEKYSNMGDARTCRRLREEAEARGIGLRIVGVHDTTVDGDGVRLAGENLSPCDFVINRYKTGRIMEALNALAPVSYNRLEPFRLYVSKYEQVRRLRSPAFLMPRWVLGTALTPYEALEERLGSPFVAKGLESSMGLEISLIPDRQTYDGLAAGYGISKEFLFEEFIGTSAGRDMRCFSIRGEAAACMVRTSADGFRSNVALGASVEACPVEAWMREAAAEIYRETGLDFLGLDFLFGEEKPYFCEINVMPGIEGIEKASGLNIAGMIIETIERDLAEGARAL